MKIYETIQQAKESKITSLPGIYYFRNKINNKYYIGQAINIRKRFQNHYHQIQIKNIKYPIYEAIIKHGECNFEFGIIGVFKVSLEKNILKKKLDILEIKYIKEYNSYGIAGYNQTKGGDGGILGYKMTEEQKEHIKQNSLKVIQDGRYSIYVYDISLDKTYTFLSGTEAEKTLEIPYGCLRNCRRNINKSYKQKYIIGKTLEELNSNIKEFKKWKDKIEKEGKFNPSQFDSKFTIEEYKKIKEEHPSYSVIELANLLKVCKKTIYNYEHRIINNEI